MGQSCCDFFRSPDILMNGIDMAFLTFPTFALDVLSLMRSKRSWSVGYSSIKVVVMKPTPLKLLKVARDEIRPRCSSLTRLSLSIISLERFGGVVPGHANFATFEYCCFSPCCPQCLWTSYGIPFLCCRLARHLGAVQIRRQWVPEW